MPVADHAQLLVYDKQPALRCANIADDMLRGCAFALLPAVLVTLCSGEVCGQAPMGALWLSAHMQTQATPKQAAPSSQAPPANQPSSSAPSSASPKPAPHTISVTFDYNFDRTPACADKIQHHCVKQFIIYDISAGSRHARQIGTIALPEHPYGLKHGIAGKTDPHVFESGKHLIAVVAQEPEPQAHPLESNTAACTSCTIWVNIP